SRGRTLGLTFIVVSGAAGITLYGVSILRAWLSSCCVALGLPQAVALCQASAAAALPAAGDRTFGTRIARVVERHGITWKFDRDYVIGTFANGDPWVVGPVRIVGIEPQCIERAGRILNGAMLDPDPSVLAQGYDSALFGEQESHYRPGRNAALEIARTGALSVRGPASLVAVASRSETGVLQTLRTAAVLTCLAEVPAPDAFRPPYVAGDKTVHWRAADLDYRVLGRLPATPATPSIDGTARAFEHLWLDHFPSEVGRCALPLDNMPGHSRDLAALVGSGALLLQLDVPNEQKRELYVRLVQLGIDLHGCVRGGCHWRGAGSHGGGRKLPILLAGRALGDARMLAIGREFDASQQPKQAGAQVFAEDSQTFYVRETSSGVWNGGYGGYTAANAGLADWGFAHDSDPRRDDARWTANPWRSGAPVNGWVGEALAARLLGLQAAWNHPAFFDFMDRYMRLEPAPEWRRAWVEWHGVMWDTYRSNS
ncbi:MAG: hypothetical protein ABIP94_09420, partial [Planctomycetota bacterium]